MRPLLKEKEKKKEKGKKKTARKMAQCVEKLAVKSDNLSSKLRIHMVEREPILKLFSDLHIHVQHICVHTHNI